MEALAIGDPQFLQWAGCWFGLLGAAALALKTRASGWGFVLFLVSNVFWIGFGIATNAGGLVAMQLGMSVTSTLGVWRWLVRPYLDERRLTVVNLQSIPPRPSLRRRWGRSPVAPRGRS